MSRSSFNSEYEELNNKISRMIETKVNSEKKIYDLASDRNGTGASGAFQINNFKSKTNTARFGTGTGNLVSP